MTRPERPPSGPPDPGPLATRPDLVLVLMDDFSMDLLQTMPSAARMAAEGASYPRSFVVDSLCCVSRASLFTGQYPHQHGVLTNTANLPNPVGPIGGWEAFHRYGDEQRSFNLRLQEAGWTTGFIGKYLNQYDAPAGSEPPPGWSDWRAVLGGAYQGWDFLSTHLEDGRVVVDEHPAPPETASPAEKDRAYVGRFVQDQALDFIRTHRDERAPYFLEVATYAPHARTRPDPTYPGDPVFAPELRDRPGPGHPGGNCGAVRCGELTVADLPGFDDPRADNAPSYEDGSPAPAWRTNAVTVTRADAEHALRNRARMVASIDRMLTRILDAVGPDTYVVLTSDNGFHLGQHQMERGKGLPYDSDVHVPLLVTGPGIAPGPRAETAMDLDLAPTFEDLAGLRPARYRSGISLVPSLRDPQRQRRRYAFFEHTWAPSLGDDPDRPYSGGTIDEIPSYVAVRGPSGLLVRLDLDSSWEGVAPAWEFYDYSDLEWERTNTYAEPGNRAEIARLKRALADFDACAAPYAAGAPRDLKVTARCRLVG